MTATRPAAIALLLAAALGARAAPRVLRIGAFAGDALSPGESAAVQNLVTSYAVELKSFRVLDAKGQELALREAETAVSLGVPADLAPLAADYILSSEAQKAAGLIVFTMDLTKVATGEKRSLSEPFSSVNDLILALRRMTLSLFGQATAGLSGEAFSAPLSAAPGAEPDSAAAGGAGAVQAAPAPAFPSPSLALIAGTWKGDKGIDRVTLFNDGRGIALLSTGRSMRVRAVVSGALVLVTQDQPNLPDFYKGGSIDLKTARAIASQARPWRWVFSLSEDRSVLFGSKESVFVRFEAEGKVSVDNNYVRDARWERMFR
ncbi:MAG TPA: hypothetical protein PLB91_11515 [Spirochaetales bacterium]|nr:hypothetical protein [Spirochaetales bacterium]HRY55218.1 hypothetical protein [Spirochaetia bacterium]HRZ65297.1 hypothetical protein [Spirochaetia bacterium]